MYKCKYIVNSLRPIGAYITGDPPHNPVAALHTTQQHTTELHTALVVCGSVVCCRVVCRSVRLCRVSPMIYASVYWPSLAQIMTCRLFDAKPLFEPISSYWFDPLKQNVIHSNQNTTVFIQENQYENFVCKMAAILFRRKSVLVMQMDHVHVCHYSDVTYAVRRLNSPIVFPTVCWGQQQRKYHSPFDHCPFVRVNPPITGVIPSQKASHVSVFVMCRNK